MVNFFPNFLEMGGSDMDGHEGMVYQDEDGNLIMYNHEEMGDDEDGMGGDDYGMEGSPGVSSILVITAWLLLGSGDQLRREPGILRDAPTR